MGQQGQGRRNPLSVKLRFKNATLDEFIEQHAHNVSRAGIFVRTRDPMEEGTLLKFDLQLRDDRIVLHGIGRVVWKRTPEQARHQPPGMGIKLIKVDPESRATIERIVQARGGGPGRYEAGLPADGSSVPPERGSVPPDSAFSAAAPRSFFPDTTLPQQATPGEGDLDEDEEPTRVRHASEFLAQALTEGGADARTTAEAQARASRARLRDETLRQQEAQLRSSKPPAREGGGEDRRGHSPSTSAEARIEDEDDTRRVALERARADAEAREPARASPPRDSSSVPGGKPPRPPAPPRPSPSPAAPSARGAAAGASAPGLSMPRAAQPQPPTARKGLGPMVWLPVALALIVMGVGGYFYMTRPRPKSAPLEPRTEEKQAGQPVGAAQRVEPEAPAEHAGAADDTSAVAAADQDDTGQRESAVAAEKRVALEIRTQPSGASLFVDERMRGHTPMTLRLPARRRVTLSARLRGYEQASRTLRPEQVEAPITLQLRPLPYVLEVRTEPSGARVNVLDKTRTSPATIELGRLVGPVGVEASKPGYESARQMVPRSNFAPLDGRMHSMLRLKLDKQTRASAKKPQMSGAETSETGSPEAPQPEAPETKAPEPQASEQPEAPQPEAPQPEVPETEPPSSGEPESSEPQDERDLPINPF